MNDPQTTRPRAPELALLELPGGEQGAAIARSWGRSLPSALACALLVFVAVGSLNVYANPRGEFPTSNVPPLPEQEAAYKMWLVEGLPAPPRTVVLGSSWMQKIDPDVVEAAGAGAAFNFAVAGAHPVDLVDLADALDGRGRFPQALLVGVDENRLAEPPPHFR
ncbi:MAG TPA: hypothetical protein VI796_02070, partial [Candidatus Thermoplasmatota archaeon]|nr:hypothetical protein [Candidatus Thermoplasmatota archaeon]